MDSTLNLQVIINKTSEEENNGGTSRIIRDSDIPIFAIYGLIAVTSILANGVAINIIIRNTEFHTLYNFLLLNLAVADFIAGIFSILKLIAIIVMNQYEHADNFCNLILCKFLTAAIYTNVFVSLNTLTVVAFERYYGITKPIAHRTFSNKRLKYVVGLVWIWSTTAAVFVARELEIGKHSFYCGFSSDETDWPTWKLVMGWFGLVAGYVFPIFIITALYSKVVRCVWIKQIDTQNSSAGSNTPASHVQKRKSFKVVKLLILITVLFMIAMIPELVYFALVLYDRRFVNSVLFYKIGIPTVAIIAINPFVYTLSNPSYRAKVKIICQ